MWARKWSWMEPHSVQSFGADAWTADRWEVIPGTNVRTSLNVGPWAVTNQRAVDMPWKFLNPPWFSRNARRWGIISLNHSKAHLLMVSHFQLDAVGLFFFCSRVAVWDNYADHGTHQGWTCVDWVGTRWCPPNVINWFRFTPWIL